MMEISMALIFSPGLEIWGIDLNIEPVLAWAGQTNDRLGLLTDAITGNGKGFDGFSFFIT